MATLWRSYAWVIMFLFLAASVEAEQDSSVFISQTSVADLAPSQQRAFFDLKDQPTTKSIKVINVNPEKLKTADVAVVELSRDLVVNFKGHREQVGETQERFDWVGNVVNELGGSASIMVNGKNVTGSIRGDVGNYAIRPLGGGAHVLIEIDPSKFPADHPAAQEPQYNEGSRKKSDASVKQADILMPTITVMTLYSKQVAATSGDATGLAGLAVLLANNSYTNSDVRLKMVLASNSAIAANYDESGDMITDLAVLKAKATDKNDQIFLQRNEMKADVIVMLVKGGSFCGLADSIAADESSAFAIVSMGCIENQSFAHEVGHLIGARHNIEEDSNLNPYFYGHGYCDATQRKRTIMAYPCDSTLARSLRWSSTKSGWGNSDKTDNARVLNERAIGVSLFR